MWRKKGASVERLSELFKWHSSNFFVASSIFEPYQVSICVQIQSKMTTEIKVSILFSGKGTASCWFLVQIVQYSTTVSHFSHFLAPECGNFLTISGNVPLLVIKVFASGVTAQLTILSRLEVNSGPYCWYSWVPIILFTNVFCIMPLITLFSDLNFLSSTFSLRQKDKFRE